MNVLVLCNGPNGPGEKAVSESGGVAPDCSEAQTREQQVKQVVRQIQVTYHGAGFPNIGGAGDGLQGVQRVASDFLGEC